MSGESAEDVRMRYLTASLQRAVDERARELDPDGVRADGGLGLVAAEIGRARAVWRVVEALTVALAGVGPVEDEEAPVEPPPAPAVAVPDVGPRNQRGTDTGDPGSRPGPFVMWGDGQMWRRNVPGRPDVEPDRYAPRSVQGVTGLSGLYRGRGLGWRGMTG